MKNMKKLLSILLACLVLCGTMGAAMTASAAQTQSILSGDALSLFLKGIDIAKLNAKQIEALVAAANLAKGFGIDIAAILAPFEDKLPFAAKAALHEAGLKQYPVWERSAFMNFVFKYLLFGWIWMK